MSTSAMMRKDGIQIIEFHMMDKRKYYPMTIISGFTVRSLLYPFNLVKTRIQIQKHSDMYKGIFDAFTKIRKAEGIKGFYKGFWISNLFVLPQLVYISTYETTRIKLKEHTSLTNSKIRSFISGGCASVSSQFFVVPIDVVSQHLMMIGVTKDKLPAVSSSTKTSRFQPLDLSGISKDVLKTRWGATRAIVKCVYKKDGLFGFYKGFLPSVLVYTPNSALWWYFYDVYSESLATVLPIWVPRLVIQCVSAPLGGITTALITNPVDIVRARMQVEGSPFFVTWKELWKEERFGVFRKGLAPRLVQSVSFSFFIILGYESIKRLSLLEEHKQHVRW